MHISCPECDTKFIVTEEQIGKHGRKVKCSKCLHIWHQRPNIVTPSVDDILSLPLASTDVPAGGINLPALLPIKIQPYLYGLPIVLIGLIIFMLVMLFPNSMGFTSLLGNRDLGIKDLQIENNKELGKIVVNYKVHNSSAKNQKIPLVRIRLFDTSGRVIQALIDDHTQIDMQPGQFIQIKAEFVPAPPSANSIDVMLGNKIDFFLR